MFTLGRSEWESTAAEPVLDSDVETWLASKEGSLENLSQECLDVFQGLPALVGY